MAQPARDGYAELFASLEASGDAGGALRAFRQSALLTDSLRDLDQARAVGRAEGEAGLDRAEVQRRQALGGAAALGVLLLLGGIGVFLYRRTVRRNARDADTRSAEIARQAEALEAANADLAQTNAVVREAQGAQARFFETASHELRTPLTLTLGPLDDLRRASALPPTRRRRPASLMPTRPPRAPRRRPPRRGAPRGGRDAAPPRARRSCPHRDRRGRALRGPCRAGRCVLSVKTPSVVDAVVDAAAIERALANLVANALRHTPAGGTVTLSLSADATEARLTVADTGPGVPPDALPHLFERFFRADERAGVGSGLGLGLAREWAERHGGRVEAASLPGEGATFTIVLPLTPEATLAPLGPDDGPFDGPNAGRVARPRRRRARRARRRRQRRPPRLRRAPPQPRL